MEKKKLTGLTVHVGPHPAARRLCRSWPGSFQRRVAMHLTKAGYLWPLIETRRAALPRESMLDGNPHLLGYRPWVDARA